MTSFPTICKIVKMETFVVFDIETTGLPWQERNQTKIIELCMIAVTRQRIRTCKKQSMPKTSVLSFLLNPQRKIHPEVTKMTGLSRRKLCRAPKFIEKFEAINDFLKSLKKPVCLIAHNGNSFDYKILLAECKDIFKSLSNDIYCADSIVAFRQMFAKSFYLQPSQKKIKKEIQTMTDVTNNYSGSKYTDHQYLAISDKGKLLKKQNHNTDKKEFLCLQNEEVIKTHIGPGLKGIYEQTPSKNLKLLKKDSPKIITSVKTVGDASELFYDCISSDDDEDIISVADTSGFISDLSVSANDMCTNKAITQKSDLITDDEDEDNLSDCEWPELKFDEDQLKTLDKLCSHMPNAKVSSKKTLPNKRYLKSIENDYSFNDEFDSDEETISDEARIKIINDLPTLPSGNLSYTLSAVYKALLKKEPENAHRAEIDCNMLLECIIETREEFLPWVDKNCRLLTDITPLHRY